MTSPTSCDWPTGTADRIDWAAPWFAPWRARGERIAQRVGAGRPLHDALNAEAGAPLRFVSQSVLAPGESYESHVFATGTCPTRPGLHDFFNGLVWLELPKAKARLNALQAAEIAAGAHGGRRGPVRDAITVFDENGAVLDAPPPLWEALLAREWKKLFVELRPLWAQARLRIFGHALLEQLVYARKGLTAHIWRAPAAMNSIAELDAWLVSEFTAQRLAAKPFTPLPVLGVPGWWAGNQNFSFYDDSLVFRPARQKNNQTTGRPATS